MEAQLAAMGYETRQTRFDCPGWEYEGEELHLEGEPVEAGAQFYSVGCDVTGQLAPVKPDGKGAFDGEVAGKIALAKEADTTDVIDRNKMLLGFEAAGAVAAIMQSVLPDTYSTKMFRTPESKPVGIYIRRLVTLNPFSRGTWMYIREKFAENGNGAPVSTEKAEEPG